MGKLRESSELHLMTRVNVRVVAVSVGIAAAVYAQ